MHSSVRAGRSAADPGTPSALKSSNRQIVFKSSKLQSIKEHAMWRTSSFVACLVLFSTVCTGTVQAQRVLRVDVAEFDPCVRVIDGHPSGYDVDVLRAV